MKKELATIGPAWIRPSDVVSILHKPQSAISNAKYQIKDDAREE